MNEGWKPNWSNDNERKWCIVLDMPADLKVVWYTPTRADGSPDFRSEEAAQKAIEIIGEDVLKEGFLL